MAATCARCGVEAEVPASNIGRKDLTPDGWSNVQVTGAPIVNAFLCPTDTAKVRKFLGAT